MVSNIRVANESAARHIGGAQTGAIRVAGEIQMPMTVTMTIPKSAVPVGTGFGKGLNYDAKFGQADNIELVSERLAALYLPPDVGSSTSSSRPKITLTINGQPFVPRTVWPGQAYPGIRHKGSDILQQLADEIAAGAFSDFDPDVAYIAAVKVASQLGRDDFLSADGDLKPASGIKLYQTGVNVSIEHGKVQIHKTSTYVDAFVAEDEPDAPAQLVCVTDLE